MKRMFSSLMALTLASVLTLSACGDSELEVTASTALVPEIMAANPVVQNPYLPPTESIIHNDCYNSDVTNKVVPLGIYPEVAEGITQDSPTSPPAFFYDLHGNAVSPYTKLMADGTAVGGGIAIRDMSSDDLTIQGSFLPAVDDGAPYGIQISYSFVDAENQLVGPTNTGHVVMLRICEEDGTVLPVFEKTLDVDVVTPAMEALGEDVDRNLLSIIYDYEGNLWFVTGGFHIDPALSADGFLGYLERECIDKLLAGEEVDPTDYLHYQRLGQGEGAENGIASHPEGCVILTNLNCYLLSANDGVETVWAVPYESSGGKGAVEGSAITGAGLAWGGGSSPTLTNDLCLFTDNQDVVTLYAVEMSTGEVVCTTPVLDLGEDVIVSVENSISAYGGEDRTMILVCNWYGAGSADLFRPGADSSVQSYDNLYDPNWMEGGNSYMMPGVQRVDVIRQEDGSYTAETVWTRSDLADTSMIKFATATGHFYGYTQDLSNGKWGFYALDKDTGETIFRAPVGEGAAYNNIAVGIMQGDNGNTMYCPTNSQVLARLQDRFVYLPDQPERRLDLSAMERQVLRDEEFASLTGQTGSVVGYQMAVTLTPDGEETVAFRVNGLTGPAGELTLFRLTADGDWVETDLLLTTEAGETVGPKVTLREDVIYEVRVPVADGDAWDLDISQNAKTSVVLVRQ